MLKNKKSKGIVFTSTFDVANEYAPIPAWSL